MSNSMPPDDGSEQFDGRSPAESAGEVPLGPQTPQRPRPDGGQPSEPPDDGWQRVENPWQRAGYQPQTPSHSDSGVGVPTPGFGRPQAEAFGAPPQQTGQLAGGQQPAQEFGRSPHPAHPGPASPQFQQASQQPAATSPGAGQPGRFGFAGAQAGGVAAAPAASRRRSLIIAIIAVLVVLVLVAVLVTVMLQRRNSSASGARADTVRDYLTAIADGHSQRALGYLADQPKKAELLTDKTLAVSKKLAPISGISVSEPEKGSNTLQAWYKIGDQRYQQQFTVLPRGSSYVIEGGTATADISNLPKGLSYELDGVSVKRGTVTLFPGKHRISAGTTLFDLGKQADFVARAQDRLTVSLTPRLTSSGKKAAKAAIDQAIKGCLASKTLKAGCGLTLTGNGPGSFKVKDGSVKRSLSKEAAKQLDHLQLITGDSDPTLIRTTGISGNIRTVATCQRDKKGKKGKKGKKTKECTLRGAGTSLSSPQVRVAGDKLKVEWF